MFFNSVNEKCRINLAALAARKSLTVHGGFCKISDVVWKKI